MNVVIENEDLGEELTFGKFQNSNVLFLVSSENKRDQRTIEQVMADTRAKKQRFSEKTDDNTVE